MTTLRELTIEELTAILSRGSFAELISTIEHTQFECKSGLYDTKALNSKIELAKDVSALANSKGGYLLIGPATKKNPLHEGDEIISVSEFPISAFRPDSYRDILNALIYPPISELKVQWHPGTVDPAKGIASIYVPPKSVNDKPFLVAQSAVESKIRGNTFGYFERVGDDALPTTVQMIRDMIKDGRRYGDLERRMDNFEGLLAKIVSRPTVTVNALTREKLLERAADARIAAKLADVPSFFLIAAPADPVKLSGLFSSKSSEHAGISNPPEYRRGGFDINPDSPIQYLGGELVRRLSSGRKGLELWQDGTLIFVGRNDEDFLGWAVKRKRDEKGETIYINNYVLTEVVSLFLTLTIQIFSRLEDPPEKINVCLGMVREDLYVNIDGARASYELSSHPIDRVYGSYSGRKVPAEDKVFWSDFELQDAIPEVEALKLLKEIYHWFGIPDEQIPYVDSGFVPARVDRAKYT